MKSELAILSLRAALQLSPDNLLLRRHLAATLAEDGQMEAAQAEMQQALSLAPDDVDSLLQLARILGRINRPEAAAARLSHALSIDNRSAEAHLEMARALCALRSREKAALHYEQAIEIDPTLRDLDLESDLESDLRRVVPETVAIAEAGTLEREDAAEHREDAAASLMSGLGIPLEHPEISFEDVGGMEALKEQVRLNIIYPFQRPDLYEAYGKKVGGGILLYGPPGCGKTFVARATAGECQARFIAVGIEDVLHMWMGESERRLHAIFEAARGSAPAIVFFDEFEALAGNRAGMDHSPHYRALVNQFLAEMDGIKSSNHNMLIMGATNSPWHIDPAFRRPGRFDKVLFVPPPDEEARIAILRLHCRNKPTENIDYARIARQMKRFSGADIQAVCESAAEIALRETLKTGRLRALRTEDFLKALSSTRPTTDEWLGMARNYVTYSNQAGLYDAVSDYLRKGAS